MPGLTIDGQKAALDWMVAQYPFIALCTTAPTDAAPGTEATYGGYTRKQTTSADWAAPTSAVPSVKTNANDIVFAQCTSGSQTATHVEMWSAAVGGVRGAWGALQQPIAVSPGIAVRLPAGTLNPTMD